MAGARHGLLQGPHLLDHVGFDLEFVDHLGYAADRHRQFLGLAHHADSIFHIDLHGETRAGLLVKFSDRADLFEYMSRHVPFHQQQDDVRLADERQAEEALVPFEAFAAGMIDHRAARCACFARQTNTRRSDRCTSHDFPAAGSTVPAHGDFLRPRRRLCDDAL